MGKVLSAERVRQYEERGVLFPITALAPDDVTPYRDAFYELERRHGGRPSPALLGQTHLFFKWAYDLATHPAVLDAVEDVLGPDVMIWTSQFFAKHAPDPAFVSWHQDGTYWGLDTTQVTTAWIALTPSTPANGCMRVVAGSHQRRILPHRDTFAENNLLSRGQEVEVEVAETDATDVVLQPGQFSLHHVNMIHGSNPNPSTERRVGMAVRFMTPRTRQVGDTQPVVLACGVDRYHHFEVIAAPPTATIDEGIQAQEATALRLKDALLRTTAGM